MKVSKQTIVQRRILPTGKLQFIAAFSSSKLAASTTGIPYSSIRYSVRGEQYGDMKFIEQNRAAMHNAARAKKRITQRDTNNTAVAVYADISTAARMTDHSTHDIRFALNNDVELEGSLFTG